MGAGAVRAPLHLGHDGRVTGHPSLPDDASPNSVPITLSCTSSAPRGSSPARSRSESRADVPLPQGERSTWPSAKTVTFRCRSGGPASTRLPEDDAVDVAQLRLLGMDERPLGLERRA